MKRPASKPRISGAKTIDDYLDRVPEPARTTLGKLRDIIRAAAPAATEGISYQLPAFRCLGMLVGFGATANHCAFYVMSGTVLEPYEDELRAYDTSKGTIRFPANAPLPAALVKQLVKARMAENEARATIKAGGSKPSARRSRPRKNQTLVRKR
jgi:uncharacterized protein YdhG (YjbR/CyaY superfamily)